MVRMPRLVVGSFQRCSVYRPMPNRTAVTVVKIRNRNTGICEIWAHKLTTSAVEQPMISRPPMISPQRMLLSSMKELSTSENGRRGGRGGGVGCSYLGAGSSSMMNVGTRWIMISSSLATSAAVTTEGTLAGTGVSTGTSINGGGGTGALAGTFTAGVTLARSARRRFISRLYVHSSILPST